MFDIIVPTYNRYDILPEFFANLEAIDKTLYTLWLIDDCSPKKDASIVPAWDNIRYIQLPENIGQAGARNYAIKNGNAPYVISLDDDAWFVAGSQDLKVIAEAFSTYPDAGCLMFNIATPKTDYIGDVDGLLLPLHVTCGCAYRRNALEQIGGFNSKIHSGAEETDISLKLYRANWDIRSLYSVHVYHKFDPGERSVDWYLDVRYKTTRNSLIIAYLYYPALSLIWVLPGRALSHIVFAIKTGVARGKTISITINAIFAFIGRIPSLRKDRMPLSQQQFKKWTALFKTP
ncbi:glycosyltransferase [Mucilaginibacter sp. HMF5004]|uniref:glycosyltransferase family 2 protein n=1 Tax=Mucilaginibacter rivuli TaxID=2857527 RepID=UPI001C5F218A|nr:glycosyltransferase [Mucilaginibacter rivuli]MBW4890084.1 glycosyltransferase [Mucilaginibacter rivuli]